MYFFLKHLVTLFYKKLRIKIVVSFLCESGPWFVVAVCQPHIIFCNQLFIKYIVIIIWLCALKDLGVHAAFTSIEEYGVDLFPLDTDVLSMEMDMSFRVGFILAILTLFIFLK